MHLEPVLSLARLREYSLGEHAGKRVSEDLAIGCCAPARPIRPTSPVELATRTGNRYFRPVRSGLETFWECSVDLDNPEVSDIRSYCCCRRAHEAAKRRDRVVWEPCRILFLNRNPDDTKDLKGNF